MGRAFCHCFHFFRIGGLLIHNRIGCVCNIIFKTPRLPTTRELHASCEVVQLSHSSAWRSPGVISKSSQRSKSGPATASSSRSRRISSCAGGRQRTTQPLSSAACPIAKGCSVKSAAMGATASAGCRPLLQSSQGLLAVSGFRGATESQGVHPRDRRQNSVLPRPSPLGPARVKTCTDEKMVECFSSLDRRGVPLAAL